MNVDGQYFMTPSASTVIRNANRITSQTVQQIPEQSLQSETTQEIVDETPNEQEKVTYVWLSATGSKYHSYDHCGNMNPKKARKVTLSEAESLGKTACKNCW